MKKAIYQVMFIAFILILNACNDTNSTTPTTVKNDLLVNNSVSGTDEVTPYNIGDYHNELIQTIYNTFPKVSVESLSVDLIINESNIISKKYYESKGWDFSRIICDPRVVPYLRDYIYTEKVIELQTPLNSPLHDKLTKDLSKMHGGGHLSYRELSFIKNAEEEIFGGIDYKSMNGEQVLNLINYRAQKVFDDWQNTSWGDNEGLVAGYYTNIAMKSSELWTNFDYSTDSNSPVRAKDLEPLYLANVVAQDAGGAVVGCVLHYITEGSTKGMWKSALHGGVGASLGGAQYQKIGRGVWDLLKAGARMISKL